MLITVAWLGSSPRRSGMPGHVAVVGIARGSPPTM
ncbi:hypothetical protein Ae263Ps1_6260c [Pseudonocardia sp. Ae263_Ps1]|nr:hypothetical protein Ae263Ps1_6260c [Pseudonocardia sp. Ae263_Ps1]